DSPRKNRFIGAIQAHDNVAKACNDYGIPPSTGYDLWNKFLETGTTSNRPRSGRPSKLDEAGKAEVVRKVVQSRRKAFQEIGNEMMPPVGEKIIRNACDEQGYHRCVAKKVPYLDKEKKRKRLAWENRMKGMTEEDWNNVAWSDEAYVCLGESKGRVWVTRRLGEELLDECCVPVLTQPAIRCMTWGSIMKGVKGPLVILEYPGGKG
ncbi:hypothetical protein C8J56DRAFT_755644, partial [Mycena floridula]